MYEIGLSVFWTSQNVLSPFLLWKRGEDMNTSPEVVVPVEIREMTVFETDKGVIHVIHEVTLGDLLISTILTATLIFMVVSRVVRSGRHV